MWYWLYPNLQWLVAIVVRVSKDSSHEESFESRLINSDLIDADFLAAVRVIGFLLGLLIAGAVMRRVSGRFAWILMVFIGALCTKGLITLFERLGFYTWGMMQASPWFIEFCAAFVVVVGVLGGYVIYKSKRRFKRYSR